MFAQLTVVNEIWNNFKQNKMSFRNVTIETTVELNEICTYRTHSYVNDVKIVH